jgi:hypothetical protein
MTQALYAHMNNKRKKKKKKKYILLTKPMKEGKLQPITGYQLIIPDSCKTKADYNQLYHFCMHFLFSSYNITLDEMGPVILNKFHLECLPDLEPLSYSLFLSTSFIVYL